MKVYVFLIVVRFASACVQAAAGANNDLNVDTSTESSSGHNGFAVLRELSLELQDEDISLDTEEMNADVEEEEPPSTTEVSLEDTRTMPKPLLLLMEVEASPTTLTVKHDSELSDLADKLFGSINGGQCKDLLDGDWYDSDGPIYTCDWYAIEADFRCNKWGNYAGNFGYTATEACCACGGGHDMCSDTEGWVDDYGDGCQWYSVDNRCADYGADSTEGQTANDACCVCGGGTRVDDDGNRCTNTRGWIDDYGDGCLWYSQNEGGCEEYGNESTENGQTANEACCVCGGGETDTSDTSAVYGNQPSCSAVDGSRYNMCLDLSSISGTVQPWMDAFIEARSVWESVIIGDLGEPVDSSTLRAGNYFTCTGYPASIDDSYICGTDSDIDGVGNILGSAGTTYARSTNEINPKTGRPYEVALAGYMSFDVADINYMMDQGSFRNVILHEMGHVLGIGSLWEGNGLYANDASGVYAKDSNAQREWEAIGCTGYLPVETDGGRGTAGAHWDEQCLRNELMTGYLSGSDQPLSTITVGTLQDMGYDVVYSQADPFSLSDLGSCPDSCPEAGQRRLRSPRRATITYSKKPISPEGRAAVLRYAKSEFLTLSREEPNDLPKGVVYVAPDVIDVLYAQDDGIRVIKVTRQEADEF